MKLRKSSLISVAFFAALAGAGAAGAGTVSLAPNSAWNIQDDDMSVGSFFTNDYQATANEIVRFTDLFVVGDQFGVYVNGALVENSPAVVSWAALGESSAFTSPPFTNDPNTAWASSDFSKGSISVHAGDVIAFTDTNIPLQDSGQIFPDGTIAVSAVSTPVPEPATWAMLMLGVAMIGFASRRWREGAILAA